jgi:hypothetical protein
MSRKIKFRGQIIDSKEWVYGSLISTQKEGYVIVQQNSYPIIFGNYWTINGWGFRIIPKSVGQYTGLKDKNGIDIYVGDLIMYQDSEIEEVYFCDDENQFRTIEKGLEKDLHSRPLLNRFSMFIKIVGNIHENQN